MKRYWLTLSPETFFWLKNNRLLLYNSDNQKLFVMNSSPALEAICTQLLHLGNLYTIELEQSEISNPFVSQFIEKIRETKSGVLTENNGTNLKPTSYYPYFKLQNGVEQLKWEHDRGIAGGIADNLHELTIYINGSKHGNNNFYKQIPYPINFNGSLNVESLISFISGFNGGNLHKINIVGDVYGYQNLELLLDWLLTKKFDIQLFLLSEDMPDCDHSIEKHWTNGVTTNLIIDRKSSLFKLDTLKSKVLHKVNFLFVVCTEDEVEIFSEVIEKLDIKNYEMRPLFIGTNLDFFRHFVYTTHNDLENCALTKREIFANMTLNVHSFGKITVMPDHKVYSNVNNPSIGLLGDSNYNLIYKEMTEGQSWLRIRDMEPCCNCVYQWLCPSPSNYEMAISKPNLCHVVV